MKNTRKTFGVRPVNLNVVKPLASFKKTFNAHALRIKTLLSGRLTWSPPFKGARHKVDN